MQLEEREAEAALSIDMTAREFFFYPDDMSLQVGR